MRSIDTDPDLLWRAAAAAIHAGDEGWRHMKAEFVGDIPALMTTLTPTGPYAYTILPQVNPDGSVLSPVLTDYDDIEDAYKIVRGRSWLYSSEPLTEIRGAWYQFTDAITRGQVKGQDKIGTNHVISIFPVAGTSGITGELVWVKVDRALMGSGPAPDDAPGDELAERRQLLALHNRYCDALKANDADAVVATFADGVQGSVRDYVAETGTLTSLHGRDDNLAFYRALFDKYELLTVDLLNRSVQAWYVFAELRVTARRRDGAGSIAFNTAEFFIPARDGRFILRVGHGTDPAWPDIAGEERVVVREGDLQHA